MRKETVVMRVTKQLTPQQRKRARALFQQEARVKFLKHRNFAYFARRAIKELPARRQVA
jgi:hypothetical protein